MRAQKSWLGPGERGYAPKSCAEEAEEGKRLARFSWYNDDPDARGKKAEVRSENFIQLYSSV